MEAQPVPLCLKVPSFGCSLSNRSIFSIRPFHKQVERNFNPLRNPATSKFNSNVVSSSVPVSSVNRFCFPNSSHSSRQFSLSPAFNGRILSSLPVQCSFSDTTETNPVFKSLKGVSLESIKMGFSKLTPFGLFKWTFVFSIAIAATKWSVNVLLNPFFWMYLSMTWLFWPWLVAVGLASYSLYCLNKHLHGEANAFEQFAIVTSAFTWLTLVPPAHFNGFLEGWPVVFFFVYHYFFFLNVSVRKRLYGDYNHPKEHDPRWDISLPNWHKLLLCAGVMVGHWLAAFEGPELHLIPGGWSNIGIWTLIMMTLFMQYHSTLYLAKYSEKVVVPTAVVQFGPYRFVRHPIYASTMLLFVAYCVALRAPLSALFIAVVCSLYYGNKAKLEESLMIENFGERYMEYASKVRYKLIPFVY